MQAKLRVDEKHSQFSAKKYLSLETYRKNGQPVKTPVWFLENGGLLYVYTDRIAGKAKRIRKNPHVRVVPCAARGAPEGVWVEGEASFVEGPEAARVKRMIDGKYGLTGKIARLFQRLTRGREASVVISIRI